LKNKSGKLKKKISTQGATVLAIKQSSKDLNTKVVELKSRTDDAAAAILELRSLSEVKGEKEEQQLPLGTLLRKEYWQADFKKKDQPKKKGTTSTPGTPDTKTSEKLVTSTSFSGSLEGNLPKTLRKGSVLFEVENKIDSVKAANVLLHDIRPLLFKVSRNGGHEIVIIVASFPPEAGNVPQWILFDTFRQKKNLLSTIGDKIPSSKDPQAFLKFLEKKIYQYQDEYRFLGILSLGEGCGRALNSDDGLHQLVIAFLASALEMQVCVEAQGPGKPGQFLHEHQPGFADLWTLHQKNAPATGGLVLKLSWNVEKYLQ